MRICYFARLVEEEGDLGVALYPADWFYDYLAHPCLLHSAEP
jgi:hypothetical protein